MDEALAGGVAPDGDMGRPFVLLARRRASFGHSQLDLRGRTAARQVADEIAVPHSAADYSNRKIRDQCALTSS